jgi:hypothetical protein
VGDLNIETTRGYVAELWLGEQPPPDRVRDNV